MKIRFATFNLFQFCAPPYSYYIKKDKFDEISWKQKLSWITNQIKELNADIIGFQEVFSKDELQSLVSMLGYKYFITSDTAKLESKNNTFKTTTVALASKYPLSELLKIEQNKELKNIYSPYNKFARTPIKVYITLPNQTKILFYVTHFKSNMNNNFEYHFKENDTLSYKKKMIEKAIENDYSMPLKQRLFEASTLFFDIKKNKETPTILVCDLNDRQYSATIDALTNEAYHNTDSENNYILLDAYNLYSPIIYNPHPEFKGIVRTPTSYFLSRGNVLDYIFVSNHFDTNNIKISSYEVFDKHLQENKNGSILKSDHAQVVCEVLFS